MRNDFNKFFKKWKTNRRRQMTNKAEETKTEGRKLVSQKRHSGLGDTTDVKR